MYFLQGFNIFHTNAEFNKFYYNHIGIQWIQITTYQPLRICKLTDIK